MTNRANPQPAQSRWGGISPWLVFGPLLVVAGAVLGQCFPSLAGGRTKVWHESATPAAPSETRPPAGAPATTPQPPRSLAPVVAAIRPGVVRITNFQRSSDNQPPTRERSGPYAEPTEHIAGLGVVLGSGFVVHTEGLIVTAHHVVEDHRRIMVDVPGHRQPFAAELVGEDPVSDLAVLRLADAPADLQALEFGSPELARQGDLVFSIGNPFEFHNSLSVGWITYRGRHLPEDRMRVTNEYLQFSAPVNPGDSGAAVCDIRGRIVGMTRRTMTAAKGIAFAVPSKVIMTLLDAVHDGAGRIKRGYIGVEFRRPTRPSLVRGLVSGAEVTDVAQGHPADTAGVRVGDVILSFDGQPVDDAATLYDRIIESRPGSELPMSVLRGGHVLQPLTVVVGEAGKPSTSV